ncbi:hypothetical protein K461DRAFT_160758 [Myriangium duriaei CBS 260.36]|uniref:Uncharacterized protein n=1 Tax=Myriangium duriaei CBS 260.36 TaxID=1168546 RepID=A0A9P4MF73_9PEZI|nr:hypothetical protein K461DRAFT_160758 [Myriangium duriaei CBS 260.36]
MCIQWRTVTYYTNGSYSAAGPSFVEPCIVAQRGIPCGTLHVRTRTELVRNMYSVGSAEYGVSPGYQVQDMIPRGRDEEVSSTRSRPRSRYTSVRTKKWGPIEMTIIKTKSRRSHRPRRSESPSPTIFYSAPESHNVLHQTFNLAGGVQYQQPFVQPGLYTPSFHTADSSSDDGSATFPGLLPPSQGPWFPPGSPRGPFPPAPEPPAPPTPPAPPMPPTPPSPTEPPAPEVVEPRQTNTNPTRSSTYVHYPRGRPSPPSSADQDSGYMMSGGLGPDYPSTSTHRRHDSRHAPPNAAQSDGQRSRRDSVQEEYDSRGRPDTGKQRESTSPQSRTTSSPKSGSSSQRSGRRVQFENESDDSPRPARPIRGILRHPQRVTVREEGRPTVKYRTMPQETAEREIRRASGRSASEDQRHSRREKPMQNEPRSHDHTSTRHGEYTRRTKVDLDNASHVAQPGGMRQGHGQRDHERHGHERNHHETPTDHHRGFDRRGSVRESRRRDHGRDDESSSAAWHGRTGDSRHRSHESRHGSATSHRRGEVSRYPSRYDSRRSVYRASPNAGVEVEYRGWVNRPDINLYEGHDRGPYQNYYYGHPPDHRGNHHDYYPPSPESYYDDDFYP